MISIGTNIASNTDTLKKVCIDYLVNAIRNPKTDIMAKVRQLRIVRQLAPSQYAALKRQLPYFVCAMFNPPYRKTENFAYTEYFIIDIDKLSEKGLSVITLKQRLRTDDRIMLMFTSPSGDGIKIMMRLKERCYDANIYRLFYQLFVQQFSSCYSLEQVIDNRTCDVTRACFISVDSDVYYNPQAVSVDLKSFVDAEADVHQAFQLRREVQQQNKNLPKPQPTKTDLDKQTLDKIRLTLNPNAKLSQQKPPAYVPKILDDIMDDLTKYILQKGVELSEVINISYGKKLRFKVGLRQAEVNLFYGKRGFSVVQSPRTGTDPQTNQLMADVVEAFIVERGG